MNLTHLILVLADTTHPTTLNELSTRLQLPQPTVQASLKQLTHHDAAREVSGEWRLTATPPEAISRLITAAETTERAVDRNGSVLHDDGSRVTVGTASTTKGRS